MADQRTSTRKRTTSTPSKRAEKTAEKSANKTAQRSSSTNGRSREDAPRTSSRPRLGATKIAASAAQQLLELTGRQAEGVTGLERSEDGWTVQVEVVEVRRIPETTDVLALYEVQTDERGELMGYRRLRRYARGDATED
jgi:hypothetical protein